MSLSSLTNVQRELLALFAYEVSEQDLLAIKQLLADYFAERATADMDQFVALNRLTGDDLNQWAYDHERAATGRP